VTSNAEEDLVLAAKSRVIQLVAPALMAVGLLSLACSSSPSDNGGGGGATGGRAGGSGGVAGSGSGGSAGVASGGGSGGDSSGGTTGSGGSSGSGMTGGSAGTGEGSGGAAGNGSGGSAGDGGSETGSAPDGGSPGTRPARVLIYTKRSTPTHDASIPVATKTLSDLFKAASIEVETSEATTVFTASNLARFGAVVMVNSNGVPFGMPGTSEAGALADFVRAGGGLAAFHAAGNTSYPAAHPFIALLGGAFQNTGGGVRNVTCAPEGQHPVTAKIPASLPAPMDETYVFGDLNPKNQVVLRCDPAAGATKLNSAWVREEGAGRVFYTTLGHGPPSWAAAGSIVTNHAWPGILWVLGRGD
jgi:type 1 glutamine amidotransferase